MTSARWALRPFASASFAWRSVARRTPSRASSAHVGRANLRFCLGAHAPVLASAARVSARPFSVGSSSPVSLPRQLSQGRGMFFSSLGAAFGGDHLGNGMSPTNIDAPTETRRAFHRHVTHVSSLSDPLPEDVPSWTAQSQSSPGTDDDGTPSAERRDFTASPPSPATTSLGRRDDDESRTLKKSDAKKETNESFRRVSPRGVSRDAQNDRTPLPTRAPTEYAVPMTSRIFCNRSLNMTNITAVGFDMDYTLAMYKPETFEKLAYAETKRKLVEVYGYPAEILDLEYDHEYMVRGLVVDKRRGNVLKMDRHKYVKVARHGFASLSTEARIETYCESAKADQFSGDAYANVDTLFALGETYLFCQLVELKERLSGEAREEASRASFSAVGGGDGEDASLDEARRTAREKLARKEFSKVYDEIRASVDLCHRDGTLKRAVAGNPGLYIHSDDALVPMLKALRASGKKVFLLTNSLWDFTNVVMNFLVADKKGDEKDVEWTGLFDVVITGSCKPGFFENERTAVFEVDVQTCDLRNTDDGAPVTPVGASEAEDAPFAGLGSFKKTETKRKNAVPGVYQGGSYRHLHAMLGVHSGNQILYVGDHIYGDVMRSKKTLGWRTMLVVPELAHELRRLETARSNGVPEKIRKLRNERDSTSDAAQLRRWRATVAGDAFGSVEASAGSGAERGKSSENFSADPELASLTVRAEKAKAKHREVTRALHASFHPVWGQLMKAGSQNSRFAHQLERYACLYTSHARNLIAYSPQKTYRGQSDRMPHDDLDGELQ